MATLQKIRNKGPLIAIIIGLALFAFILGDMVQSGQSIFAGNQFTVAKINGKKLTLDDYQAKITETEEYYKLRTGQVITEDISEQIRTSVWETIIREYTLYENLDKLGIGVNSDELFDMVQGNNVDPTIQQLFVNQETGVFDPTLVIQFLKNMELDETGQSKAIWLYIENEIKENRYYSKYYTLVQKGLFATTNEAKIENEERNYIVDMQLVMKNYLTISDSSITVNEAEMKKYYTAHKNEYKQEEARDIAYITFDVVASAEDSLACLKEANDVIEGFKNVSSEDLERFVNLNSDEAYVETLVKNGDVADPMMDSIIFNSTYGTVYGPYLEDGYYKVLKVVGQDTTLEAKARHILLSKDKYTTEVANKKADSIMAKIRKGEDFAALATKFSDDPGSASQGGDLGWFKKDVMVQAFNDACFNEKIGSLVKVETEFGVHIIDVMDRVNPLKYATIQIKITPSQKTYQTQYSLASEFAGVNNTLELFDKAVEEKGLTKKVAPALTQATNIIAGLETPRELIRWSFQNEKGTVSDVYELGDRYVVAVITETREKGIATMEQVKEQVEAGAKQEKKAEQIIASVSSQNFADINAAATFFETAPIAANSVSFNSYSISGAGYEPNVLAKAMKVEKDKLIGPIKGKNGVYYFVVTSITPSQDIEGVDFEANAKRLSTTLQSRANYQAYEALKKHASIEDSRAKFF